MDTNFADQIRQRFPEGLTGIIAIGGTRTSYILEHNRDSEDPGHISDFDSYATVMLQQYFTLIEWFFDLGGQNLVIPPLAYQRFTAYDVKYMHRISALTMMLTEADAINFYRQYDIDPYFVGIDTLLKLPEDNPGHQLGLGLTEFQHTWNYQEGRRKLLWEIAPIPLYSFWNMKNLVDPETLAEVEREIEQMNDLEKIYQTLYRLYAWAVYGTEIPVPHFYLGTNRNGDLKLRSMAPIALLNGSNTRFYYTPYPSLFTTFETLQAIIQDAAFGNTMSSKQSDYAARLTSEMVNEEYERVMAMSADTQTTLGFVRRVDADE